MVDKCGLVYVLLRKTAVSQLTVRTGGNSEKHLSSNNKTCNTLGQDSPNTVFRQDKTITFANGMTGWHREILTFPII